MISCESVLNRAYNFARVCPNYKQGIACPKQDNKIEVVVLNRVCILGFFCPKQGQSFKPSAGHIPCGTRFLREFNFADWRFFVFCGKRRDWFFQLRFSESRVQMELITFSFFI